MKIRSISSLFALAGTLALAGCGGGPETNAPADIAAVNAVRAAFVNAFNAGDADAIGKLYTNDAVSEGNHRPTDRGPAAVVASNRAQFAQVSFRIELTPEETKTIGTFGYDRGTYKITAMPKAGGAPMNDEGRYVVLLAKGADGAWKVTLDIDNSSMPMPPPPAPTKGKGKGK